MTDVAGQCLCGAVRFHGAIATTHRVTACHCGRCRRWGGGAPFMAVHMPKGATVEIDAPLTWFRSSADAERGFCHDCGSSLFFRAPGAAGDWAVSEAALDTTPDMTLAAHIWADFKPDFYEIANDAPQMTEAEFLARGQGGSS